jgi:hypothetical protein
VKTGKALLQTRRLGQVILSSNQQIPLPLTAAPTRPLPYHILFNISSSGYAVFGREQRILFANSSDEKVEPKEVMTLIGSNWKALGPAEQSVYNAQAKKEKETYVEEKERYKRLNPGWSEPLPKAKKQKLAPAPPKQPASAYTYCL